MSATPAFALTVPELARMLREAVKDKSYQDFPLGQDAAVYLRAKRKRLTDSSFRDYEACLDKLARYFPDLLLEDLEPPHGTDLLEEFLDARWGGSEPRTYNKNLSIVKDFLKFHRLRGRMDRDPCEPIERAKARQVYRTTFTADQRRAIIASQDELRDRIALRLLLDYGLRKGALTVAQIKHFDHVRKQMTIFTKGAKVRTLPIPDPAFWHDLGRHIIDVGAEPSHYLMCRVKTVPRAGVVRFPTKPMGVHGMHLRMHKARHTAGQRVLDATGNLKAVQKLLGHASIQTTGDSYADWDIDQLAQTLADVLALEDVPPVED
jgi:integrase/recombinase XerC